jgi:DNA polymerase-1
MPTLYIIDGYAQFFRAYHAIRTPMSSPVTKEPTNMTFGFVGMLLKLLRGQEKSMADCRPDYLLVTLDVSGDKGTFRSSIYPEYKAHRPEPPADLFPQVDRCLALLKELGIPVIGAEGFEADDVIATLVTRLRHEHPDLSIRIVSKDKDLKQLLRSDADDGAGVALYDIHTDTVITAESFKAESGLEPSQVIDMLALMGDTVDNVPGVEGVGEKTAAQLLQQYGTLDNLLAHASEIKGKRGEKLRQAASLLGLSKSLVTLRHDTPIELDLDAARTDRIRLDRLIPILRELGFNRYQEEVKALTGAAESGPAPSLAPAADAPRAPAGGLFDQLSHSGPVKAQSGLYTCVRTPEELRGLVGRMREAEVVAVDTETTGLSPMRAALCGVSLSISEGEGYYVPVRSPEPDRHMDERTVVSLLRPLLEDPTVPKCGHNLKYDLLILRRHGIELRGLVSMRGGSCDSMVSSFLIDSTRSSHGLDALALALLGRRNIHLADLIGAGRGQKTFDQVPLADATEYAAEDADVSLQLRNRMLPQLKALGMTELWERVELPLVEVLAELEWNGILVDPGELNHQRERLQARIDDLHRRIADESMRSIGRAFNPDSPKQLAAALFNKPVDAEPGLGLRSVKRTKTGHSTDVEVLDELAGDPAIATPIPALIVEYRQLTKLVNTYLVALKDEINPDTRRIHTSFHQTGAATGRLASSDPNLQNIPIRTDIGREIRKAFIAPPGRLLISADYSQIELRLLAHLSRDPGLIEAFERGEDIHAAVAAQIAGISPAQVTREQRDGAKMVNFGIVYGITPYGLARRLKIPNSQAEEIITGYKKKFAGITTFLEECIAQARRFGYVETILRRRRAITGIDDRNPQQRALAERVAINSVVQGSAADLIKVAMVDLHARLSEHAYWGPRAPDTDARPRPEIPGVRMLLQIHDELVFEAPRQTAEDARRLIVDRMENCMKFLVPIKVESRVAENWFEGK